jgi:hypothetical protein
MLLSEFKEYLAYGELSQLNIGDLLSNEEHLPKLISGINLGLVELYKRFPIKLSEVNIQLANYITEYLIHSSKAESNMPEGADPTLYYVKDSIFYPFKDDIVSIEAVFNEYGEEIPLNDEHKKYSVFTTGYNVLNHPYPESENVLLIQYKAAPTKLALDSDDTVNIDISPQFTEALINYVAYRSFAAINMNSAEAVNYYAKFEASCAQINNLGLWHKDSRTNMRLENSGWL